MSNDEFNEARRRRALTGSKAAFEQAQQDKPIDALDAKHAQDGPAGAVPVLWKDPTTGRQLKGRSLTVLPNAEEIANFGNQRAAICGLCANFDLERGRKEIQRQKVLERVVLEEKWMPHHVGDVTELGVCKARPSMATTYIAKACVEDFKPRQTRH